LRSLSIRKNHITSFDTLRELGKMSKLEEVNIEGNFVAETYPNFRKILISMLPRLKMIDSELVSKRERREAQVVTDK